MRRAMLVLLLVALGLGRTVCLSKNNAQTTVRVSLNDRVKLSLMANPSTGLQWTCTIAQPVVRVVSDRTLPPQTPGIVGAPTTRVLCLRPLGVGSTDVVCTHAWNTPTLPPAETLTFQLVIVP